MRLDEFDAGRMQRALELYVETAFEGAPPPSLPDFSSSQTLDGCLECFEDETPRIDGHARRYVLRLGNSAYPFMKLVLQEHLIRGEFSLDVDTHDQMFARVARGDPRVQEMRETNLRLRDRILQRLRAAGLPTMGHLLQVVRERVPARSSPREQSVLVVDDHDEAGAVLCALLEQWGFSTQYVEHGGRALEVADATRHDLVVMDVEMPVLDGLEACRTLKADPERAGIPVLLATAGRFDLEHAHEADAFLTKPFQVDILLSFIEHLLPPPRATPTTN